MTDNTNNAVHSVNQFSKKYPAFTKSSLRTLIFNSKVHHRSTGEIIPNNGLEAAGAILRIGSKILIHEERFFKWLDKQQKFTV